MKDYHRFLLLWDFTLWNWSQTYSWLLLWFFDRIGCGQIFWFICKKETEMCSFFIWTRFLYWRVWGDIGWDDLSLPAFRPYMEIYLTQRQHIAFSRSHLYWYISIISIITFIDTSLLIHQHWYIIIDTPLLIHHYWYIFIDTWRFIWHLYWYIISSRHPTKQSAEDFLITPHPNIAPCRNISPLYIDISKSLFCYLQLAHIIEASLKGVMMNGLKFEILRGRTTCT